MGVSEMMWKILTGKARLRVEEVGVDRNPTLPVSPSQSKASQSVKNENTAPGKPYPFAGTEWVLDGKDYCGSGDPFGPKDSDVKKSPDVTVIDCRDGWVKYRIGNGCMFNDERAKISKFTELYRPFDAQAATTLEKLREL